LEVRIRTLRKRGRRGGGSDNKDKEKMRRRKASSLPNRGVSPVGRIVVAVVLSGSLSTLEARTDL